MAAYVDGLVRTVSLGFVMTECCGVRTDRVRLYLYDGAGSWQIVGSTDGTSDVLITPPRFRHCRPEMAISRFAVVSSKNRVGVKIN
jgi:hypothetical protein